MNLFAHAETIADAAVFFDAMRGLLPEEYRAEAERHVEIMHDTAQCIAGCRVAEIYAPDDAEQIEVPA